MAKAPKPQFRADREEESSESALDRHRKKLSKIVDGGDLGFGDVAHHHYTFDHQEYVEERPISRRPLGGYRAEFDQDLPTPFDLSQPDAKGKSVCRSKAKDGCTGCKQE
uniref:Uncharacterized protein n=1 Tax=Spongospora subterranea TaxID=70186 RepID=A0A0H5RTX7_9EUKA|eukprot:CRZ12189.1 hypothetical protein [Spongospora subterranea]